MAKKVATRPAAPPAAGTPRPAPAGAPKRPATPQGPANGAPKRPAPPQGAAGGAPKRPAGAAGAAPTGAPKRPAGAPPAGNPRVTQASGRPAPAQAGGQGGATPARRGVTGQGTPARGAVRPRTRRNAQKANAGQRRGIPSGDYTIKSGPNVPQISIVRPSWADGSLTFRPYPAWNPDEASQGNWVFDPYRFSADENAFSDFYRRYPACYYLGSGDDAVTFLLYDYNWDETEYNRKTNPYVVLYNAVKRAVKREFTHPEWLRLIEGSAKVQSPMSAVCDLYYFQGAIFKRGTDLYVGRGRSPKGLGQKDFPQIIQLKNSAGSHPVSMLNALNPDWEGDPEDYPNSMLCGDPVAPEHGRFITIYNPKKEALGGEDVAELDSFEVGADGGVEGVEADEVRGYRARIDEKFMINGRATKITPKLEGDALEVMRQRLVFFDDIINMPASPDDDLIEAMHAEQCLLIARAMRGYRKAVEFGWHDHPEYLTTDVKKILSAAKQVSMAGARPDKESDPDADLYEAEPIESATLGEDVEGEFAESGELDEAAEYLEVDDVGEVAEAVDEVAEGEEYEEVYEEVEVAEEEVAEGEEGELAEGEEYEEVYEEVEVAEGEEYAEEYDDEAGGEELPEGEGLEIEEDEARQAMEQAQARAGRRSEPAPMPPAAAPKKAAPKKAPPPPAAAAPKKAPPPPAAPPKKAPPKKAAPPAPPAAPPRKAAPVKKAPAQKTNRPS